MIPGFAAESTLVGPRPVYVGRSRAASGSKAAVYPQDTCSDCAGAILSCGLQCSFDPSCTISCLASQGLGKCIACVGG